MGVMDNPVDRGQLVVTPHPITLDGQRSIPAEIIPGETLGDLLRRSVPDWAGDCWEVRINGVLVPYEVMDRVRPKDGTLIEARGVVKRTALAIVAFAALTYFTFGIGTYGGMAGAIGGFGGALAAGATFVAGSILINKVLGPKLPGQSQGQQADPVHSISAARNRMRPYEPVGLLFGSVRIAPDIISQPYTWYEGNEQYLAMILSPGINVESVEELYLGNALLSSYEGVQVWHSGFPGMPEQPIPLYSNADTIAGAELETNGGWVERTTSPGTVQIQVDIEGLLYDVDNKGRIVQNNVPVIIQYRAIGASAWSPGTTQVIHSTTTSPVRRTFSLVVPEGQYEVRVRVGQPQWHDGTPYDECRLSWTWMRSIQPDDSTYNGLPRIGIKMRASGQLNGTPDEITCVAHSRPVPVWNGSQWVTQRTSNPGAHILAHARGINSGGERVAGMGLADNMIELAAWQGFCLHCAANQHTYDWWITDARSHDDVMNSIALAGMGQITWAGGRLSVVWAADEQPLSGIVNMATIKRGQFQVDYTLANAADGVEVTYYDAETWEAKTLRIPSPGVTTMLNPAQLQLEGVTSEARAAEQGRFHLAQSLYQYKDISFATDLEHLSYRRLSLLALQHDLTQWGFGGRVRGASIVGGVVSIALDEPVPAPTSGNAYIGLRIPGERVYRVFGIRPFTGTSDTLTLIGAWPSDAALPGDTDANPAHDTIWIYDFKQTPGYRVRVVQIQPESGMSGARVSVVPESPQYWNYVKTGEYIPAPGGSSLQTRPVASGLRITEQQVVQGDTVFTELTASFEVSGPVGDTRVLCDLGDGILKEVARTSTRSATWRIPRAGTYTIVVRPYSPEGNAGVAASIVYTTLGADAPPVLVDLFDVEQRSGGVRLYTWGWLGETIQSADFAGVEIRYIEGEIEAPTWANMTPVGEDGYFTAPFEAVIPQAGTWTFACRSRNTSGTLSVEMRVITRTLQANLGQVIDDITADQVEQQRQLDQEKFDRAQEDLRYAQQAAADATAKANAARDAALAQVDALAAEVAEITGAPEWEAGTTYEAGWLVKFDGALYRARVQTTGDQPDTSPAAWEKIGDYASVAEVAAAALQMATVNASELEAVATQLNAITARMPTGQGGLATQAMVAEQAAVLVNQIEALARRTQLVEARMPAGSGALATEVRVGQVEQASAQRDTALGQRVGSVESALPGLATNARVTQVEQASVQRDEASSALIEAVRAEQRSGKNLLQNASGDSGTSGWTTRANFSGSITYGVNLVGDQWRIAETSYFGASTGTSVPTQSNYVEYSQKVSGITGEATYIASAWLGVHRGSSVVYIQWLDSSGNAISAPGVAGPSNYNPTGGFSSVPRTSNKATAPANAVAANVIYRFTGAGQANMVGWITRPQFEEANAAQDGPSPWSEGVAGLAAEINATTAKVNQHGGQIASHTQSIQGLQATSGDQTASINRLTEVNASSSAAPDVRNASFETDLGWSGSAAGNNNALPANAAYTVENAHSGRRTLRINGSAANTTVFNNGRTGVRESERLRVGGWIRSAGTNPNSGTVARIGVRGLDVNGDFVPGSDVLVADVPMNGRGFQFPVQADSGIYVVPAGVFTVALYLATRNHTSGSVAFDDIFIERLTQADERAMARDTVALDVNGNISGTVNENDGTRSVFSVIADVFQLIASGTIGAEFRRRGNSTYFLRFYAAAVQYIIGINFGRDNNLTRWFGPNIGEQACHKGNGSEWGDNTGSAYFGGSLSAGVPRNAAQSTQVSATAQVETGVFSSFGRPRTVTYSLAYTNNGIWNNNPGNGTANLWGDLVLERSLGGGPWTQVSTFRASGTRVNEGTEPGMGWNIRLNIGGSSTFTDNSGGTNVNYRVRIVATSGGWPASRGMGTDPQGLQSLAVISTEE